MATFLLELFSEEIPSRMQQAAAEQLTRLVTTALEKNAITFTETRSFVSPRHLALQVMGLPLIQPDVREEKRGPKIGAPEQALKGFLSSTGLTLEQCEQRDGYYYATIEKKGGAVADTLKKIIEDTLSAFSWPKSMRWGARRMQWVRPLHRIVALLDSLLIPAQFGHLTTGYVTEGHRFLSSGTITIGHAETYEQQMNDAHVMVDFAARREAIKAGVTALANQNKLEVIDDDALLNEVTGLVEWPVPLLGTFEAKFLDLPPEVLISEMKNHQRYFALRDASGKLANQFITVANMVNADGGTKVMAGNSRVVRARLSDGEFYWEQDKKTSLADWGKKLSDVVFHAKVGMMNEKVARIEKLAVEIAKAVGFADIASVQKAARLCKADLTSGMVGEFTELQGIMGRYYALAQGEPAEIADAIRDHYIPRGASEKDAQELLEQSELSGVIAVADKLDSIISLFAAGEKPTGSKDPLALRRAALGVVRIIDGHQWNIDLSTIIRDHSSKQEIIVFIRERLIHVMREKSSDLVDVRHDVIEAILSNDAHGLNIMLTVKRMQSLADWLETTAGKETLAAIKRASNILAAEEKKHKTTYAYDVAKLSALVEPSEKMLQQTLQQLTPHSPQDMEVLAGPIQAFFADVMVNAEDAALRDARLALLAGVRAAAQKIADFSKLEG